MKKYNYVYITINLINGKQYVGEHSTNNIDDNYLGSGQNLRKSIRKYGRKNFNKKILEHFDTKEEAFDNQETYINKYDTCSPNGYNISPKGGHNVQGCFSEETLEKIGNALKNIPKTEEHKNKLRESNKGQIPWIKGKIGILHHTEETKEKMRKPHGKMTEENVEKNRIGHLKENLSEETLKKMRESAKKRWNKKY